VYLSGWECVNAIELTAVQTSRFHALELEGSVLIDTGGGYAQRTRPNSICTGLRTPVLCGSECWVGKQGGYTAD